MQSLCTLRNHCRQWPRNTRYQADATPYLGRTSTGWIAPALPGALIRSPRQHGRVVSPALRSRAMRVPFCEGSSFPPGCALVIGSYSPDCCCSWSNAAISRHFERDPIPYALETDWPVGAAGVRTSAYRIGICQTSAQGGRTSTCASRIKDARAALLTKVSGARSTPRSCSGGMKFSRSDFEMQRFESRRPN